MKSKFLKKINTPFLESVQIFDDLFKYQQRISYTDLKYYYVFSYGYIVIRSWNPDDARHARDKNNTFVFYEYIEEPLKETCISFEDFLEKMPLTLKDTIIFNLDLFV